MLNSFLLQASVLEFFHFAISSCHWLFCLSTCPAFVLASICLNGANALSSALVLVAELTIQSSNFYFPKWFSCNNTGRAFLSPLFFLSNYISFELPSKSVRIGIDRMLSPFVWQWDYEAISYFNFNHQIPCSQLNEVLTRRPPSPHPPIQSTPSTSNMSFLVPTGSQPAPNSGLGWTVLNDSSHIKSLNVQPIRSRLFLQTLLIVSCASLFSQFKYFVKFLQ